jgi:hypothetical protein
MAQATRRRVPVGALPTDQPDALVTVQVALAGDIAHATATILLTPGLGLDERAVTMKLEGPLRLMAVKVAEALGASSIEWVGQHEAPLDVGRPGPIAAARPGQS